MQEALLAEQGGNDEAELEAGETVDEAEPVVEPEGDEEEDAGEEGDAPRAWEQTGKPIFFFIEVVPDKPLLRPLTSGG